MILMGLVSILIENQINLSAIDCVDDGNLKSIQQENTIPFNSSNSQHNSNWVYLKTKSPTS